MSESETDYGSSPCKTVPDADKQILEWTSRLELETVQLRDTSESLFKIIKENVGELAECRRLFQRQLETEKDRERQKDNELLARFTGNENLMLNVTQQMQDLTAAIETLHGDIERINERQHQLECKLRQGLATPESQGQGLGVRERASRLETVRGSQMLMKSRVLIPWDEVQEDEMKQDTTLI